MKVLHITNDYFYSKIYRNLHQHFLLQKIDSVMFVPSMNNDIKRPKEENIIQEKCFNKTDRFFFFKKQRKILRSIKKYIVNEKPDCIHGHFVFSSGYACLKLKQRYGIPYIVAVRNTDVTVFFKLMIHLRRVGIEILQNADYIVFISPAYRDFVINKYVPKKLRNQIIKKAIVIPNGVDSYWLNNTNTKIRCINDRKIRLITVGAVNINKNQIAVAKAAQILNNSGFRIEYTIVGNIENERVFKKLKKYKFINYVGSIPKEKLIHYYRTADIHVLPSFTETFGLVYVEAMSQGLPVIYTRKQGFDGQFSEGEVGYSVLPNNPNNIAECILKCLDDYNRLSKKCVDSINRFDWTKISERYKEIYKEVLK